MPSQLNQRFDSVTLLKSDQKEFRIRAVVFALFIISMLQSTANYLFD